ICTSIVLCLSSSSRRMNTMGSLLLVFSSFLPQVSSANVISLRGFYIPWLLFATFVAVVYTTFLESYTVLPETRFLDLPFDDMMSQNFTIVSNTARIIQDSGYMSGYTLLANPEAEQGKAGGQWDFL